MSGVTWQPKSVAQIDQEDADRKAQYRPWPAGKYAFTVKTALLKTTKIKPDGTGGDPMFELDLDVYSPDGKTKGVRDWLVVTNEKKMFDFFSSIGLGERYHTGSIDTVEMEGTSGTVAIKVTTSVYNGETRTQNAVSYYVRSESDPYAGSSPRTLDDLNEVPF